MIRDRLLSRIADRRGVSALEFALIAPLLIVIYFGCVEVSVLLMVDRKSANVVSTLADLVAQAEEVDSDEVDGIFNAARSIMAPYDDSSLEMRVTSVVIDGDSNASVEWSRGRNMSALGCGANVDLPDTVVEPNQSLIMAEVELEFASSISSVMIESHDFSHTFYARPRRVESVPFMPSSECG
ncbi:MAG: pilus assembly protein [Caulobacterales bacterium]|nr:pilus assembly protein [Caulobacterales bacterium]